jgi:hypothetical protein
VENNLVWIEVRNKFYSSFNKCLLIPVGVICTHHRVIMRTEKEPLVEFNKKHPKPKMDTAEWNNIIHQFYNKYCTGEARAQAYERSCIDPPETAPKASPQLSNFLIRLQEFSTVVEANRAMKAGNIGRLMNVWKMWLVMSQGLKGLNRNFLLCHEYFTNHLFFLCFLRKKVPCT